MAEYRQKLTQMVFRSGLFMKPFFDRARIQAKRVIYTEGENETVLRAVQEVVDEKIAEPILIGNRKIIEKLCRQLDLHIKADEHFKIVTPHAEHSESAAASFDLLQKGEADALICGTQGKQDVLIQTAVNKVGMHSNVQHLGVLKILLLHRGAFFIANSIESEPDAQQLVETALMAVEAVRKMGVTPRLVLLSYSNKGSCHSAAAERVREATALLEKSNPDFEFDGEIQADTALLASLRAKRIPDSRLTGDANILVMPSRDAANIAFNMAKVLGDGIAVGPILLGISKPVFVLSSSATVRRIVNMTALAVTEAQDIECDETGQCVTH